MDGTNALGETAGAGAGTGTGTGAVTGTAVTGTDWENGGAMATGCAHAVVLRSAVLATRAIEMQRVRLALADLLVDFIT
jgi:hypothetical protein